MEIHYCWMTVPMAAACSQRATIELSIWLMFKFASQQIDGQDKCARISVVVSGEMPRPPDTIITVSQLNRIGPVSLTIHQSDMHMQS